MLDPEYNEDREDIASTLLRFEKMINQEEDSFFDIETLEKIADHYFTFAQYEQALKACDLGLNHFPYTLELIILKSQILGELQKPEEGIELIENSILLFPSNIELLLVKGALLTQLNEFETAVQLLLSCIDQTDKKMKCIIV